LPLICFKLFTCSGTLSYIFNNFEGARTFSDVVAEAKEAGYTEPDPRDDLSGTDVSRKVLIIFN
jgi:aspartokinase/homoserine dehydrogenase 1